MKFGCSIGIFLNSADLIGRSTDISKCFRWSLRRRDNESRMYYVIQNDWSSLIGWLVDLAYRPFKTVFQSISSRLPERGERKEEMIDERKMSKQLPPAPAASAVGPYPALIQISRTPWHWKCTQHHRTTLPPQGLL